jgi:D-alanyl-D-alanine carboxypeptidase/D-alanyl-D-alanine-endopeptidase (penicillin-binding protein 4)
MRAAGAGSGAYVLNTSAERIVLQSRASAPRVLASNTKIFTSSAALDRFGVEGQFETDVLADVPLDGAGVLRADLYLRGGGDPTFGSSRFVRRNYGDGGTVEALAAELSAAGLTRVTGRVVGDESHFDSLRGGPESGYRTSIWVGPLSALSYNRGLARESGSAFQVNPPAFAAAQLDRALAREGIGVAGSPRAGVTPARAGELADVESPSMARLVQIMNTRSDNFFAEMLLKQVGHDALGAGTTAAGARGARSFARRLGARPALLDGSGLHRSNRASPRHVASLLDRLRARDEFDAFFNSLPVAGRTGTLVDRMRYGPARGRCHAKTGTISGVSALSGYCDSRGGDRYVFSILMNGVNVYGARRLQDRMAQAMARQR